MNLFFILSLRQWRLPQPIFSLIHLPRKQAGHRLLISEHMLPPRKPHHQWWRKSTGDMMEFSSGFSQMTFCFVWSGQRAPKVAVSFLNHDLIHSEHKQKQIIFLISPVYFSNRHQPLRKTFNKKQTTCSGNVEKQQKWPELQRLYLAVLKTRTDKQFKIISHI